MLWEDISVSLFHEAGEQWKLSKQLSNEILCCLHAVHGKVLMPALQLLDENKVLKVYSATGRFIYRVTGSSGLPYICLPDSVYCQCPSFRYSVLLRKESLLCKHVLAAKLASCMDIAEKKEVTDEEIMNIIAGID